MSQLPAPRVLIADDQPDVLEALRLLLKGEGYQTRTAHVPAGILALAGSAPLAAASGAAASGRYPTAIADAQRALTFAPWSAEAWRTIGRARLAQGERSGARTAFRRAVSLDPADWQTWAELADASSGRQRRAALGEAARRNPLWAVQQP